MIEINDARARNGYEWCTCCGSNTDTKRIRFSSGGNNTIAVVLCSSCRKKLVETVQKTDITTNSERIMSDKRCCISSVTPEQQLCEDAISRQAVHEQINCWIGSGEYRYSNATWYLTNRMNSLPPVTPTRKYGTWIKSEGHDKRDSFYTCSQCGRTINVICGETLSDYPYCHCGAKMVESRERSE